MAKLFNLARMTTATSGTGTITLGSAVSGYLTFALAGVANADVVAYGIKDGANSEVGYGVYTSSGTTLTRNVRKSTNGDALINLSGTAEVYITPLDANIRVPKGHIFGLTLANNTTDATNDIDVAVGEAADDTGTFVMPLASSITKRLDAAWAVGTGSGGLDTGSIANATYHLWLIMRLDTGVVDALFSTSATAPTMPANYTYKRRIGSILRESAAIVTFVQTDDYFQRKAPSLDVNVSNPGTSAVLRALKVPLGIKVRAILNASITNQPGVANGRTWFSDPDTNDVDPATGTAYGLGIPNLNDANSNVYLECRTNTSAQIRTRAAASGASSGLGVHTFGWIDSRGRHA
ncbi:hypothetical protein GWE18_00365 [Bradyrhizobium sp. CSA112]|uniref:hypothetical protein n=1 Tax=Bradyrhizobium sp. CSA112 TaxID=2699170 RepID=UPI0023AFE883|nr:hypothetical protein [Bradyrhizobium sp. CSA112]MDE5451329.1 hypothetical protein [Bradyrhizobium sp. CSA112]